ncbi:MAG: 2-deoxy-5-keto-D-gluconate 6-phosphate aldolase domain-containing protein [Acidimicrobiales bacterium]
MAIDAGHLRRAVSMPALMPAPLFALAFDHRSSLRRDFLGLDGPATVADEELCGRLKGVALDGLLAAVDTGLPCGRTALLIDEEYGADTIERARTAGVAVIVPVEVSGREELTFVHGDDGFGAAIERVDPAYAKVLVRYDPHDGEVNDRQRARLANLQDWLDAHARDWMLELLVPMPAAIRGTGTKRRADWDRSTRPGVTSRAISELVDAGLRPTFWKLEGMPSTAMYEAVADATNADRHGSACLVLGRGADAAAVERWLRLAAPVPTYQGFAIGRSIWWDPLRALVEGTATALQATRAIADTYRHFVDVYLEATHADT